MTDRTTAPIGIAAVVFDKDGTLFDFSTSWGRFVHRLLDLLARNALHHARLAAALGYDPATGAFAPQSPVIAGTATDIAETLLPHLPGEALLPLVARLEDMAEQTEMTEAVPLLPFCAGLRTRGLRLGLATNDAEAAARAHLAAAGVEGQFDAIYGADSGHGAKPGPGMLLAFARATGLPPARVLMVGDSRHDLIAGRAAGMRALAVLTGVATAADLAPLADAVLHDVGELPDWIDARAAG